MADWKTYAKAARNTYRKQAPGAAKAIKESARSSSDRAGAYVRAARKAADEGTREGRESLRRDADRARRATAAAAVVAGRRAKEAQVGRRIWHAVRDALLMGAALGVIWFVLASAGLRIPPIIVISLVLGLMVVRFGWALVGQFRSSETEDDAADDTAAGRSEREYDALARREEPRRAKNRSDR